MRSKSAWVLVAVTAAAAIALCTSLRRERDAKEREETRPAMAAARAPSRSLATRSAGRFASGLERTFQLEQTAEMAAGGEPLFSFALRGEYLVAVVDESSGGVRLRAHLQVALTLGPAPEAQAHAAQLEGELALPHEISLDRDGTLRALHYQPEHSRFVRHYLHALASQTQLVIRDGTAWTARELAPWGEYEADYRRDGDTVAKTASGPTPDLSILVQAEATLGSDDWPLLLRVTEESEVPLAEGKASTSRSKLDWSLIGRRLVPATGADDSLERRAAGDLDAERHDEALLAGRGLPDLLAELNAIEDVSDGEQAGAIMFQLIALFRTSGPAAGAVDAELLGSLDADRASFLIGALGYSGSASAQAALVDLSGNPALSDRARRAATVALGLLEEPSPDVIDLHRRNLGSAREPEPTALFAAGSAAHRLAATDPTAAGELVDLLLGRLARAATDAERIEVLHALGNAGDRRALAVLEQLLATGPVAVRAAATAALRRIAGADVDQLLVRTLASDPDTPVRYAAVEAAAQRPLAPFIDAYRASLAGEPASEVRLGVIAALGPWLPASPEARSMVTDAARHDGDPRVRQAAEKLL